MGEIEIYSEGINASHRLPEPVPKFHNIYEMQRKFEDHDISHFATNFRTPSPKAGPVHQVPANSEEDPKEDSDIDPRDVMVEDPDYDPRRD